MKKLKQIENRLNEANAQLLHAVHQTTVSRSAATVRAVIRHAREFIRAFWRAVEAFADIGYPTSDKLARWETGRATAEQQMRSLGAAV